MKSDHEIKQEICEIGRRIYANGYVAANDGNITVKAGPDEYWATPTGVSKGYMTPEMLIKVNSLGEVLEGTWKPSSELKMHLRVYKERPDVGAVVHAHPPTATGFAIAHIPLDKYTMPEAILSLGSVPIAEYGTPSTEEIPNAVSKFLQDHDAVLLENHGALAVGQDLLTAFFRMETLEFFAKLSLTARLLGGEKELSDEQLEKLMEVRKKFNFSGKHPGIKLKNKDHEKKMVSEDEISRIAAEVTKRVLTEMGLR